MSNNKKLRLRNSEKVDVAVLGSPSIPEYSLMGMVSVHVKQHSVKAKITLCMTVSKVGVEVPSGQRTRADCCVRLNVRVIY